MNKKLIAILVLMMGATIARAEELTSVRVILRAEPLAQEVTDDPALLASDVRAADLTVGVTVYAGVWVTTAEPTVRGLSGLSTAVVDLSVPLCFDIEGTTLNPAWGELLPYHVTIEPGLVDNLGGNNFSGLGASPLWVRIGTVQLTVTSPPLGRVEVCAESAGRHSGGAPLDLAILGVGRLSASRVNWGCAAVGCVADADCDDELFCTGVESCVDGSCVTSGDPCEGGVCVESSQACNTESPNQIVDYPVVFSCILGPDGEPLSCWVKGTEDLPFLR